MYSERNLKEFVGSRYTVLQMLRKKKEEMPNEVLRADCKWSVMGTGTCGKKYKNTIKDKYKRLLI